jgi:hypothetical protein
MARVLSLRKILSSLGAKKPHEKRKKLRAIDCSGIAKLELRLTNPTDEVKTKAFLPALGIA